LRWLPKPHGLPIKEASKERLHEEALFITPSLTPKNEEVHNAKQLIS
jgi:hypothetical protein